MTTWFGIFAPKGTNPGIVSLVNSKMQAVIDDPKARQRLLESGIVPIGGSVEAFSWLSKDVEPAHTEDRDDRFVAAFDRADGQSAFITMAYVVRAVAPGRYIYPPATAEDMYDPDRYGRTGFGELQVKAK